jgi:Fe-S oxidoreductase
MCPSYQATGEELHSTRGRANTLRLALTGQLHVLASRERERPEDALTDPAVMQALDLCLECKACKSECPTNVDMARLKAEVLDQHHKRHGLPWRNWLFGNVATLSYWGGMFAPLSNLWAASNLGRRLNESLLGIDRRRLPPPFAAEPFARRGTFLDRNEATLPKVLLFPDTFMNYHEPEIGLALVALLQRTNQVFAPGVSNPNKEVMDRRIHLRCCGRPMISNGMLDQAVANAKHNVHSLDHWREQGPIIACEPSCILTIKDDYPALLKGEWRKKARAVAERCLTFAEFLEQRLDDALPPGPSPRRRGEKMRFRSGPRRILVQPHCHQRSLVGTSALVKLLRRIPGAEVIDLDAGCCGMAGSFGYEVEHYEISRLVGEQRLFPAIRNADPDTVIVAPGFSCRLQIEHFTGRKAIHPATLLQSLMS